MKRIAVSALILFAVMFQTGCSSFERTTFQTLAASKAVIDQAQVDYEARTIPHTQAIFTVITQAKAVQATAVQGMVVYEEIKSANGSASALSLQQQVVIIALANLPPAIADVKALYTLPTTGGK